MQIETILYTISVWALPLLLAITLHEAAHGYVANKLGDKTAFMLGRVTLNPIKHIDPIGTVIMPLALFFVGAPFLFGYAKPVPVNFRNLKNYRRDVILVAAAGPLTNIFLATCAILLLNLFDFSATDTTSKWLIANLKNAFLINIVLAVFNMLPILPLDGGRILNALLPFEMARAFSRLEPFGFFIVIAILIFIPNIIRVPVVFLLKLFQSLFLFS